MMICLLSFVLWILPKDALAWGPGAHMTYALYAITHLTLLSPIVANLLKKYSDVFLYGTIAADIIFGKKYAGELYHCHNWDIAFQLLDKAENDRERAFIYGYLSHLSVDTVAHNYYVPFKIIDSYKKMSLGHTYWEMRFDQKMNPIAWKKLEEVSKGDYVDLDRFLEKNLERAIFSFSTNKKIFNSLMLISRMKKWQNASIALTRSGSYPLPDSDVSEFKQLCQTVLIEFLSNPQAARVLHADPSGKLKLLYCKEMSQDLRRYRNRKIISESQAQILIQQIRERLRETIYAPGDLPLVTDVVD